MRYVYLEKRDDHTTQFEKTGQRKRLVGGRARKTNGP